MVKFIWSIVHRLTASDTDCDVLLHPTIFAMDERQRGDLPLEGRQACGCV